MNFAVSFSSEKICREVHAAGQVSVISTFKVVLTDFIFTRSSMSICLFLAHCSSETITFKFYGFKKEILLLMQNTTAA